MSIRNEIAQLAREHIRKAEEAGTRRQLRGVLRRWHRVLIYLGEEVPEKYAKLRPITFNQVLKFVTNSRDEWRPVLQLLIDERNATSQPAKVNVIDGHVSVRGVSTKTNIDAWQQFADAGDDGAKEVLRRWTAAMFDVEALSEEDFDSLWRADFDSPVSCLYHYFGKGGDWLSNDDTIAEDVAEAKDLLADKAALQEAYAAGFNLPGDQD